MRLFGNNPRYERWRWQILTITWLAYTGFYLTRKSFAVAKVEMGEGTAIGLTTCRCRGSTGLSNRVRDRPVRLGRLRRKMGTRRVVLVGMLASVAAP